MELFRSLTVLSLEQAMTLPYLTLRLAEEGMQVIRVENPDFADPNRMVGSDVLPLPKDQPGEEQAMGSYYLPNNLGKKAITLNLRHKRGHELLKRLITELPVDIFATNQRTRSYSKLGIDYETLSQYKPDLIWVGITGFGPEHDEAAYDPILQARSGFMDLTGDVDGAPTVFGLPMVDLGAGEHAYGQVMKALFQRAMTGQGSRLDISMFQSAVSWLITPVMMSQSFNVELTRHGNSHRFFAPVSAFPTEDGFVYLAVGNEKQWTALTLIPGFEDLGRDELDQNAKRIRKQKMLNNEISEIAKTKSSAWMIKVFNDSGIPISKVNTIEDVCSDLLISEGLIRAKDPQSGIEICIAPPPVISEFLLDSHMTLSFPPRLGEHNDAIYGDLGYEVEALRAEGVI